MIAICRRRDCSYVLVADRKGRRLIELDFAGGSSGGEIHMRQLNEWKYVLCVFD